LFIGFLKGLLKMDMDMDMGMDMGMDMDMGSDSAPAPLNDTGVDFSNETQAMDFLGEILDDSYFQPQSIQFSQYFWYGVVAVIFVAAIVNINHRLIAKSRCVNSSPVCLAGLLTSS
jgi:ferric-chelate reductase